MRDSAFGAASVIADMNNDGVLDVVKQTSLTPPTHVAVTYNDVDNEGVFDYYDIVYTNAPYFVSVGDLNGDGLLDLVITDDGTDQYLLNNGNNASNRAQWSSGLFPGSGGFGGNSVIADLNNDDAMDVIITDVDVDIPGCSRDTLIYRNGGGDGSVSLQEVGQVIPEAMLLGVHDAAVFDLNGDGWLDIVMGRCSSTEIWINNPPTSGLAFNYLDGLPSELVPDEPTQITVKVVPTGESQPVDDTGVMSYAVNGGDFVPVPMTLIDPAQDLYMVEIPPMACTDRVDFYFSAESEIGGVQNDPPDAPADSFFAVSRLGVESERTDFETEDDVNQWTVVNDKSLTGGAWQAAEPNGTLTFTGNQAAPNSDATQGAENVIAFVTENGPVDGDAGANDVDGGPTHLISPIIDLDGTDAEITYDRWFYTEFGEPDFLTVSISNDGGETWVPMPDQTTGGTNGEWETVSFIVSDYVVPTGEVRLRISTDDAQHDSVSEGGFDDLIIDETVCAEGMCPTDVNNDNLTNVDDLIEVLLAWGTKSMDADVTGDGAINVDDLIAVVLAFGPCQN
jgi:hypothetical protein